MAAAPLTDPVVLSLKGKVALITGGSRGVGAACVRLFSRAGASVVFSYLHRKEDAEALVEECGAAACFAIQQELASAEQGRALVADAIQRFGRLDCLVANHGVWPPHDAPIEDMSDAQWSTTVDINLNSIFGLTRAAVAQMKQQPRPNEEGPRGHIVFISSTAGQRGEAFHADYAVTKGALISLTKSLSSELAPAGIYANCVAPGWVATEMSAPALTDPTISKKALGLIPLGRPATPDEIAGPVLFLCTPWAGFISGEILNANGGAVLVG